MSKRNSYDYRSIFEHAPDGMYISDQEGNFLLVNNHFCQTLGYSRDELLLMNIQDTYLESELDALNSGIKKLHSIKQIIVERSLKRRNGTSFYAQIHLKIISNGYIQGIVREDKFQKKLSEQLDNNEERFRQITEHIRDVFFLIDLEDEPNFLYISPAYENIWGKTIAALKADPSFWMASLHPDDRYRVIELYKKQVKTGLFDASYRILRKDGCVRWVHTRAFPIYNKQNVLYRSAGVTEDITEHMNSIQERTEYAINIRRGFNELVVAISAALELRDAYTAGHQNKVSYLAKAIAEELHLPANQVESIEIAALLHDIGKIGVPLDLLSKPSKLSDIEYELIKKHAEAGYDILKGIHFPWPIAEIVRQHHERLDGSGYPRGLKSDNIMLEAKIIAVADTIDSMSSHRPYRPALGVEAAFKEVKTFSGILFDPDVVNACEKLFLQKKIILSLYPPH